MYLLSAVLNRPILDADQFPDLVRLRENWETIRDEAVQLYGDGYIRAAQTYNDLGFNSFFRTGWKRFYVKWYDDFLPSAKALCPKTVELLNGIPGIHAVMFALLPPKGRLVAHRDPFGGSLRYHLGLVTPNSENCRIYIDGTPYHWQDGQHILFDETYIHYAQNETDRDRIILFCDFERPLRNQVATEINHFVSTHFVKATATQNMETDRVGTLNKLFGYVYQIRLLAKRVKRWSRTVYYAIKYALLVLLVYLIFF
ncbi:MAG: aspartyl/asparaginyl beta-hydroxylase domain-containing protein [Candidatus Methylomirabilales bacterium]